MSLQQRAREFVGAYDHILEQQIVGRGCSLACRDETLWKLVEDRLKDTDAQEVHCLGLDTLREMEESLKAAASAPPGPYYKRVRARGGLRGLAKAFEVLEQAALNLYLGPWRKEYRVIKMYSGSFTHYITPVLSMPQIERLFGLLGYQPSPVRPDQLCLQSPKVNPATLDDLLRLSCAFFVARCECHLLLSALWNHVGDSQWELNMVRERQRGNSLQVAFENVKKQLDVSESPMELIDEADLYRDEPVNGEQKEWIIDNEENPHSLIRAIQSNPSSPAGQTRSIGANYMPSSPESDTSRSSSFNKSKGKRSSEELKYKIDSQQIQVSGIGKGESEINNLCSCPNGLDHPCHCFDCNSFLDPTCAFLDECTMKGHNVQFADNLPEKMKEARELSLPSLIFRESGTKNVTSTNAATSSSDACDAAESATLQPISYHSCCDLKMVNPDPRIFCPKCLVFHAHWCKEGKLCQESHEATRLGLCSCGKYCARKPLVLCRYCGREYCRKCWFRQPIMCICGQTFDQESSV